MRSRPTSSSPTTAAAVPLEIEADRDALTHVGGTRLTDVVEPKAERFETEAPVVVCFVHELRPQAVGADLEQGPARRANLVVTHRDHAVVTEVEQRVVRRAPFVRKDLQPDLTRDGAGRVTEREGVAVGHQPPSRPSARTSSRSSSSSWVVASILPCANSSCVSPSTMV